MAISFPTPTSSKPALLLLIPNLGLGGAQRVFIDHARLLAGLYKVTECVFNLDQADDYHTNNELCELAVPGGGGPLAKIQHFVLRCFRLRQLKKMRGIAVAISHLEGADYVNVLSGIGERRVLCIHGSKLHDRNIRGVSGWFRQRVFIPLLYRQATRIVTVSAGIQAELVNNLGLPASKVQVINNFFDDESIRRQAAASLPAQYAEVMAKYPVIATAGRFAPEKNLLALLDIFAQVRQIIPQCKLLLVGHGEQYQALLERCQTLELPIYLPEQSVEAAHAAAVLFAGYQSNPHAFIARATVFVLPSLNEGFPMALGEAMICGVPVVTTDCPTGPREILAPNTQNPQKPLRKAEKADFGMLMPIPSKSATLTADQVVWTETLVQLIGNVVEREYLGQLAIQRMQDFTRKKIFCQWVALLEDVLTT